MQDVVRKCLQKNPKDRPNAKQLLEHKFFRQAKDAHYVKQHLLQGLPPLPERVAEIRAGKAATRAKVSVGDRWVGEERGSESHCWGSPRRSR